MNIPKVPGLENDGWKIEYRFCDGKRRLMAYKKPEDFRNCEIGKRIHVWLDDGTEYSGEFVGIRDEKMVHFKAILAVGWMSKISIGLPLSRVKEYLEQISKPRAPKKKARKKPKSQY